MTLQSTNTDVFVAGIKRFGEDEEAKSRRTSKNAIYVYNCYKRLFLCFRFEVVIFETNIFSGVYI